MPERKKNSTGSLEGWQRYSEKCSFSSDTLEVGMFSGNVLGHTPFIHWHPLALPGLLMGMHGHTHLPRIPVWNLGLQCCCCFCQDCSCWSRHLHLASEAALPVPTDTCLSTRLQPARSLCASAQMLSPMFSVGFSSEVLQTSSLCFEWIKFDATHRGNSQHRVTSHCTGITGLAEAAGSKESI